MSASSLLAGPADSLPIDRVALELMRNTKHAKEIQLISGITHGNLTRALNGEQVGTMIHA